ncbi:MAG: hypothetical protein GEU90_17040 [Gemmatimonas sp.]|nr:hypothetical protein [Gemmatimonas sp.]
MRSFTGIGCALLAAGLSACQAATGAGACAPLNADNADDCLRINQLQLLGTHNSYHVAPTEALMGAFESIRPGLGDSWQYTHRPLAEQLTALNIRQFELDVFADPEGGRFSRPAGRQLLGAAAELEDERMGAPGYKVLHVQDLDYQSTCPTLVTCLEGVRDWSLANPRHLPVMILLEVKDSPLVEPPPDTLDYVFTDPLPIRAAELDALDAEILSVFDRSQIITPDDVRQEHESLEAAIREIGWPTLAASRGKVMFALDNTDVHRDEYLRDHPLLEGRVMFTSSPPGQPTAGFIKMNEAIADAATIRSYVEQGFLIRTRADIPLDEARTGDATRRTAALSSGAQWISTDYPEESPFGSAYVVRLPGAETRPARCNPVTAPPECRAEWITP